MHRKREVKHYTDSELSALMELQPALSNAVTLSKLLAHRGLRGMTDAMSAISQPAIILARNGQIIEINREAQELGQKFFRITRSQLQLRDRDADTQLQKVKASIARSVPFSGPIIARQGGRPALLVRALEITPPIREPFLGASALLLLTDLSPPKTRPNAQKVSSALGLTLAEARVAIEIGRGKSTAEISDELRIAPETVRTHLKRIYIKLGIERQSQLALAVGGLIRAFE